MKKVMLSSMIQEIQEYLDSNGDMEISSVGTICGGDTDDIRFIFYPSASSLLNNEGVQIHEKETAQ